MIHNIISPLGNQIKFPMVNLTLFSDKKAHHKVENVCEFMPEEKLKRFTTCGIPNSYHSYCERQHITISLSHFEYYQNR